MDTRFDGKRVLVTGAGKGIGKCIARKLAACGATVIALSRTPADLKAIQAELPGLETATCNLANWEECSRVIQSLGIIHMLVNNASLGIPEAALDASVDAFEQTFEVNVKGVMNISQIVAHDMIERRKGGSIVHVSNIAAQMGFPNLLTYAASKGALDSMMRVMAVEWGPHQAHDKTISGVQPKKRELSWHSIIMMGQMGQRKRIRVNCVSPTAVHVNLDWASSDEGAAFKQRMPQRKFATEDDIARAVVFLLSDNADMITGTVLPVDGGALIS